MKTVKKILVNRAKCKQCHSIAESTNRHHLCFCSCGKIFVDGGQEYLRRGGSVWDIEELSEFTEVVIEKENTEDDSR